MLYIYIKYTLNFIIILSLCFDIDIKANFEVFFFYLRDMLCEYYRNIVEHESIFTYPFSLSNFTLSKLKRYFTASHYTEQFCLIEKIRIIKIYICGRLVVNIIIKISNNKFLYKNKKKKKKNVLRIHINVPFSDFKCHSIYSNLCLSCIHIKN